MSYIYLQGAGEESSAESFSDIGQYVQSRLNHTAEKCCSSGNEKKSCLGSLSGTMFAPSTEIRGGAAWMWFVVGSRAKTLAWQAPEKESTGSGPGCGDKWQGSFARYDRAASSWRTHQCSLLGDWEEFSETWPEWGSMQDGVCWAQSTSGAFTIERESGYLPTPRKQMQDRTCREREDYHGNLEEYLGNHYPFTIGSLCDPDFAEWMMGWPIGWTDSVPLETDKFQQWLRLHGASYLEKANLAFHL